MCWVGRWLVASVLIRDLTTLALLRLLTAASTFWLALQLSRNATRARLLIWSVVGISACYAAVGIFALGFMPNGRLFAEFGPIKVRDIDFRQSEQLCDICGDRVDRGGRGDPEALSSRVWREVETFCG